jgi:hypothetical protein
MIENMQLILKNFKFGKQNLQKLFISRNIAFIFIKISLKKTKAKMKIEKSFAFLILNRIDPNLDQMIFNLKTKVLELIATLIEMIHSPNLEEI